MMAAEAPPKITTSAAHDGANVGWASGALMLTGFVAVLAKIAGVIVAPGLRGEATQRLVETTELVTATLAYALAAMLVALVCGGSFELARVRRIGILPRGAVVGLSGLVVALASPAVVTKLHAVAAIVLAVVTSVIALVAGVVTSRVAHTRAVGAVLAMLAVSGLMRPVAWAMGLFAAERAAVGTYRVATAIAVFAVVVHALAALLAAAWLGTRSLVRGRVLANVGLAVAFVATYFAARDTTGPASSFESFLHASIAAAGQGGGVPLPYGVSTIAMFLVPASIVLASVALVQRAQPPAVIVALALALLSHGSFDVPLQALAITTAAQWSLLALADDRGMWSSLVRDKKQKAERDERPTSEESP